MLNNYLPTLSEYGWDNNSLRVLDRLLAYFFASDYSQDYFYHGHIASMAKIIQLNQHDMEGVKQDTYKYLVNMLKRYFPDVNADITTYQSKEDSSWWVLSVKIDVTDDQGQVYNLTKLLTIKDGKFNLITDYLNEGYSHIPL